MALLRLWLELEMCSRIVTKEEQGRFACPGRQPRVVEEQLESSSELVYVSVEPETRPQPQDRELEGPALMVRPDGPNLID